MYKTVSKFSFHCDTGDCQFTPQSIPSSRLKVAEEIILRAPRAGSGMKLDASMGSATDVCF